MQTECKGLAESSIVSQTCWTGQSKDIYQRSNNVKPCLVADFINFLIKCKRSPDEINSSEGFNNQLKVIKSQKTQ